MRCSRTSQKISPSSLRCCSLVETIQFLMYLSSRKMGKDLKGNSWKIWQDIDELNSLPSSLWYFTQIPNYHIISFISNLVTLHRILSLDANFWWNTWIPVSANVLLLNFFQYTLTFLENLYLFTERTFRFYYSAHIIIATPGRLEDMFKRKQEGCDLAASVKSLVIVWLLKLND